MSSYIIPDHVKKGFSIILKSSQNKIDSLIHQLEKSNKELLPPEISDYLSNKEIFSKKESSEILKILFSIYRLKEKEEESLNEIIKINLTKHYLIEIPAIFKQLATQIETSKSILNLDKNWDEEGSVGYSESTLIQAIDFITNYAHWIWDEMRIVIDTPKFLPGPEGSIDLLWKKEKYELLINIPVPPNAIAGFYGDDKYGTKIEGKFDIKSYNQGIFLCLLNQE